MAAFFACLVVVAILIIGLPIVWVIAHYQPRTYKKLVDLEDERRRIAREMVETVSTADWLTKWRFKRYIRKGSDF